jgi:glucose/arabinose dehydrogenase
MGAAPPGTGYTAKRLNLPPDILPSAMTSCPDGTVMVGSMDGDVYRLVDANRDGTPETYARWAGTLSHWPLGMAADGDDVLISIKGALVRLSDQDHDGWAEKWSNITDAWDVTKDHHDWTTGIAPYFGPGGGWIVAPATDDVRAKDVKGRHYMRGKAVRVGRDGKTEILADGLRYSTGWATRPSDGLVFFTDNQGQQKTTCEINRLVPGGWYGYPSQADNPAGHEKSYVVPTVRIPYPWARSVNGLTFINANGRFGPIDGHLILCEYNNRLILRASLDKVDGTIQGACYPFLENLLGPVALTFDNKGVLYVGSLREPAWGGEPEQGAVFQVVHDAKPHPGIREVKARPNGFQVDFFDKLESHASWLDAKSFKVRRYHHVFAGSYHSPPIDEEILYVRSVKARADGQGVNLTMAEPLIPDRIYEVRLLDSTAKPDVAHYTMTVVPKTAGSD